MNRQKLRVVALAALVLAAGAYVWAQRSASTVKPAHTTNAAVKKPGNVAQPGKAAAAPAAASAKTASAATTPKTSTAPAPAAKSPAPAPPTASKPAAVDAKTASHAAAKPAPAVPAVTSAAAPIAAAPGVSIEAAPWQDHLQKGAFLGEKLRGRLPDGTDLVVASAGFRDLQQFVAAVTASHNLKLNFDELKRRVVTDGKGLAPAIDAMKQVASATIEEQRAEYEARGLIQESKRHPLPAPAAVKAATTKQQPKKPFRAPSGL